MKDASLLFDAYGNCSRISSVGREGHCFEQIDRAVGIAANCRENVLLFGESGSGKTFYAKRIHALSHLSHRRIIQKSVADFPPSLLESLLFGTEPGAFTGAVRSKGCFEQAENSTLFLDEISELPLELQPKLLSALEEGFVTRLGSHQKQQVNARMIFATSKDLGQLVKQGLFREDLYYRIAVLKIYVPPLRSHMEDMEFLARRFAGERNQTLAAEVMDLFKKYHWPGNVRELKNVVYAASAFCAARGERIIRAKDVLSFDVLKH